MILEIPTESVLTEIFQSPSTSRSVPRDGVWFYQITDKTGISLNLSFSIFECSIQAVLRIGDRPVQVLTLGGCRRLLDARDYRLPDGKVMALRAESEHKDSQGILEIYLEPNIFIQSSVPRHE